MDAFDVLALPASLDLTASALDERYRELQKRLHPDKFAQASAAEKRASLQRAVSVNDAYRALRDELKRAEILFARHGGTLSEKEQPADPELLMEVMELREALAETKSRGDLAAAHQLAGRVQAMEAGTRDGLRAVFEVLGSDTAGTDARARSLADAARALSRLRYYRRFRDEVARFEEEALG